MGVGFSDMQKVNDFYGPIFGTDKALEIFGDGLARVLAEGYTKVYYFNNQKYDYNNAGMYKIRCLLCNSDGLFYEFMCVARTGEGDATGPSYACLLFACKDHHLFYARNDNNKARELVIKIGTELRRLNNIQ
jgi:hypothetical protein